MPCIGVAIIFFGLGLITSVIFYAWLDEREDGFCNVVIPPRTTTCIDWHLHKVDQDTKCNVEIPARRPGGHLGHMDHKAMVRYAKWIERSHHSATSEEGI
jgi:hypothetical protein